MPTRMKEFRRTTLEKASAVLEDVGMSTEIIETRRLGKFNATNENPRPLRITVPTLRDKMRLMRNAPTLKNSNDSRMKLVRIGKDMTPMEREGDLKLKREWEGKKEESTGGPRSQVDTAKRKSNKRGDVQKPRKATESAAGGRRPITVTGKSWHLHQSTCLGVLYSNVYSVLNKRAELLVYLQFHKPIIIALVEILPKNLRYPVDENEIT